MKINEVLSTCLSNMKASDDLNDYATVSSIKDLLSCIIDNPAILINCASEEKLSIALSSILTKVSHLPFYRLPRIIAHCNMLTDKRLTF